MGYNTEFQGILEFTKPLTKEEKEKLQTFMGADCREHPEWNATDLTWIDLAISDDKGLVWDGSEKTYHMIEKINLILEEMRKDFPNFGLKGRLQAQGEEMGDIWGITIKNGEAVMEHLYLINSNHCPHCGMEI